MSADVCIKINNLLLKFIWTPIIPKAILKNKMGRFTLPGEAIVIIRV